MARAVAADHGYEKTETAGRLVLRVRRQDSVLKLRKWAGLLLLVGFSLWIAVILDDHFRWRTTYAWKVGTVGGLAILLYALIPKRPSYTGPHKS